MLSRGGKKGFAAHHYSMFSHLSAEMTIMKFQLLLLLNLVCALHSFAQKTKLIEKKFEGIKQASEKYYVLKSDKGTKHGAYISYFKMSEQEQLLVKQGVVKIDNYIKVKGTYQNGQKEGEWLEYDKPLLLKCRGRFLHHKKVGIWETTKEQGVVIERYDFDAEEKRPPLISVPLVYPENARKLGIEGVVSVSYKLNKDGSITEISITKSLSPDCDKEVVKVITKLGELQKKYGVRCEEKNVNKDIKFELQ